jgi:hypothetical protein
MKILSNIKDLTSKYLLIILTLFWISCEEDTDMEYPAEAGIKQEIIDPYLQVNTSFVPFKPGTKKYGISVNVLNGVKEIDKLNVYKVFTDAATKAKSNEALVGTYDVGEFRTVVTDSLSYDDLKEGLTPGLPATDDLVVPGSGWVFRFEGVKSDGTTVPLSGVVNMVLSKYAGVYEVIESRYVRGPGEDFGNWNGTTVFIGHVDDVTLSYNDSWGYFNNQWAGCNFHFTVDPTTKKIKVPILTDCGLFSGVSAITCAETASGFKNLNAVLGYKVCDVSNILVEDEVDGHHVIKLSYGYMGANGVPRAFTEVLRKL